MRCEVAKVQISILNFFYNQASKPNKSWFNTKQHINKTFLLAVSCNNETPLLRTTFKDLALALGPTGLEALLLPHSPCHIPISYMLLSHYCLLLNQLRDWGRFLGKIFLLKSSSGAPWRLWHKTSGWIGRLNHQELTNQTVGATAV